MSGMTLTPGSSPPAAREGISPLLEYASGRVGSIEIPQTMKTVKLLMEVSARSMSPAATVVEISD